MGVDDSDVEGTAGDVISRPLHLHDVVANFGRVISAQNRPVLLTLSLHLHSKGALGSPDSDGKLSRSGAFGFAYKSALVSRENAVFHARSGHSDLGRVGRAGGAECAGYVAHDSTQAL